MAAKKLSEILGDLRSRAEQQLRDKGVQLPGTDNLDLMRLAHEIEVQYVELELQNEKLQHALKDLEKSRNAFAELYQSAPVGFVTLDRNGLILQANVAAMQILNNSDLTGTPFLLQIHPEDRLVFQAHMHDKASGKNDGPIDVRLVESSKQTIYVQVNVNIGHYGINSDLFYRLGLVNVTDRKHAQEVLRKSEQRFHAYVTASSDMVYRMNPDWTEMSHLEGRKFIPDAKNPSKTWLELYIHPDDQPHVLEVIQETIQTKSVFDLEHRVLQVDGSLGWSHSRAVPLMDENGRIIEWIGAAKDITGRKRMEEELRYAKKQLELHMDNSPLAIIEFDPTYKVIRWSGTAEQMFGWKADEILGKPISEINWVHDDDKALVAKVSADMLSGRRPRNFNINRNYRKDGSIIQCEWYNSALYDNRGRLISVLSQVLDVTEKSKTEQDLLESEERFHRLFEDDLTGDFVCTAEGQILLCNPAFEAIFGFSTTDKAVGTYISALFINLADGDSILDALKRHGKIKGYEAWRKRRDGKPIYVVENLVGHFNERGELYEIQGYVFDDTERKLAEESLQKSEQKFRMFFNSVSDPIYIADMQGKIIEVNEIACRQLGYSRDELLRMTAMDIDTPEFAQMALHRIRMAKGSDPFAFESVHRRKDGTQFPVEVNVRKIQYEGKPCVLGAVRDISDRKQAREALQKAYDEMERRVLERTKDLAEANKALQTERQRFFDVLETLPAMICLLTPDYRVAFANRSFRERFGESNGRHCYDYCFGKKEPCEFCESFTVLKTGQPHHWEFVDPDGSIISANDMPFTDVDGSPLILEMDIDITEQRKAEVELANYRERLEDLVRERTTQLQTANIKLKTFNETLEQKVAERTQLAETRAKQLQSLAAELIEAEERERWRFALLLHDDLQQMLAAAMMQLQSFPNIADEPHLKYVEQILTESITKTRELSHELSPAVLHHSGLVAGLRWLSAQMNERFGLSVLLQADAAPAVENAALKLFVFRAVRELLFNTIKHAGVKQARVTLSASDHHIVVAVSDQGIGFEPDVFLKGTKKTGFGLLSITERADYIGGSFKIDAAPGKGSRFTLTVPLGAIIPGVEKHQIPPSRNESPPNFSGVKSSNGMRVLFADDHRIMRQGLIKLIIGQPDIHVIGEAENGAQALAQARHLRPDLIIMDISMPEMDGIEATRRIKAELPDVRVIGLTMHDDDQLIGDMQQAGAEVTLSKTASANDLLKAIYGSH